MANEFSGRRADIPGNPGLRISAQPMQPQTHRLGAVPDTAGRQAQQAAQALGHAGQVMGSITLDMQKRYEAERQRADVMRVLEAEDRALRAQNDLMYNQEYGYTTLKGDAAVKRPDDKGLIEDYEERYSKALEEIEGGLSTTDQRDMFRQRMMARNRQYSQALGQYYVNEYNKWETKTLEGRSATAVERMANNWADDNIRNDSMLILRESAHGLARSQGLPPEAEEAYMAGVMSGANMTVLTRAVSAGSMTWAKDFYAANRDQFIASDKEKADRLLADGELTNESTNSAASIWAQALPMAEQNGESPLGVALFMARETHEKDPQLLKATEQRIRQLANDAKVAEQQNYNTASDDAWRYYNENRSLPPVDILARMSPKERTSLTDYVNRELAGKVVEPDLKVYADLAETMVTDKRKFLEDFANNQSYYRDKLGSAYDYFAKAFQKSITDKDYFNVQQSTIKNVLDTLLDQTGFQKKGNVEQYGGMLMRFTDYILQLQQQTAQPLTDAQMWEAGKRFFATTIERSSWWRSNRAVPRQLAEFDDIPAATVRQIREWARAKALPATEQDIINYWLEGRARGAETSTRIIFGDPLITGMGGLSAAVNALPRRQVEDSERGNLPIVERED